jgi:hypothetical protein
MTMDRTRFYEILDGAREGVEDDAPSADADDLRTALETLDDDDLLGFARRFTAELALLDRWSVREAGYVVAGGMSDDGFRAFRAWLIGKGAAAVDAVLADPEDLADLLTADEPLENEALASAALEAVDERGLPDPEGEDDAATPDGEPVGEPFDPEGSDARLPRLAEARARFSG